MPYLQGATGARADPTLVFGGAGDLGENTDQKDGQRCQLQEHSPKQGEIQLNHIIKILIGE